MTPPNGDADYVFEATASFAQQRLWFLDQLEPGSPVYNISFAMRLKGELDRNALQIAINTLVARHESLRTTFDTVDKQPVQVIAEMASLGLQIHYCEGDSSESHEQLLQKLATQAFDLRQGPLLRIHLLATGTREHLLLIVIHHIIADAWSLDVLYRELVTAYEAARTGQTPELTSLPVQYADYAEWQKDWLCGGELEKQLGYWREQLVNAPELLELPLDNTRPRIQTHAGATLERRLQTGLAEQVKQLAQSRSCTLFNFYLAAFSALLGRYAATDDLVVGTPIAGRKRTELEGLIGFFVNTLGMRIDLSGDPAFEQLLEQCRQTTLDAYAHQELPFEKLVEELQPERAMSHSPIFQVMFVLHHAVGSSQPLSDLESESLLLDSGTAKFDLTLFVTEMHDGVSILFEYNTDLFNRSTIERMLDHFETLLEGIVAAPDEPVSTLPLMDEAEKQHVMSDFNGSPVQIDMLTVNQLVERQVEQTPDAAAISFGNKTLSYGALNKRANRLARALGEAGAGPGKLVGICAERSIETVVAVLAVLKAGAAYVPIDPNFPAERVATMLDDSKAPVLLTQSALVASQPEHGATAIELDSFDWSSGDDSNPDIAGDSVYAIYTSGSTGKPKGVELTQMGLSNLVQWQNAQPGLDTPARTLQFASLSFDVSFQELFTTWAQGGTLVLVTEEARRDLAGLAKFIARDRIERVYLPFAALQPLADAVVNEPELNFQVRDVIVAGEQLQITPRVKAMFSALGDARLHNQYGPSETHVVTAFTLKGRPEGWMPLPPIGTPVTNTWVYALDNNKQPVPVGVPGELHLNGVQLAKGYLNRPELTAEKFIPNPFGPGRLYCTGDRVRFLADGSLEYLGRTDDQVKWRGFRIEPGEIETTLSLHASVKQAAVLLREDAPGDKRLVAYVVGDEPDPEALRLHIKERLPDYMVPSVIVVLDALPLTPSGKVARRSLPVPDYADAAHAYIAPRTPIEDALVQIWAEVLGVQQVGVYDDFFALGGHSLLATQLISRVRDTLNTEVPLITLFNYPNVSEFAHAIDKDGDKERAAAISPCNREPAIPLSFAQQRLWFLDQLDPGNPAYNFPVAVELNGALDIEALNNSLAELVARHETLRTVFADGDTEAVQLVKSKIAIPLDQEDLSSASRDEVLAELTRLSQLPFNLQDGPLLRAHLIKSGADQHYLLLVCHHIISDGWSLNILLNELAACYRGHGSQLASMAIQYADYSAWQRDWLDGEELSRQVGYWREQLADAPSVLELPTDRPRPPEQSYLGDSTLTWLRPDLHDRLKKLAADENCTLYMVLLAAFDTLLATYGSTEHVVVGTPIAGRKRTELEGLIGFLSNTLAIPANLENNPDFRTLLRQVKETTLGAYAHQELPFEKLVEELQPERAMSHSPIFQVMFVYQNTPPLNVDFGAVAARPVGFEMGIAKFDLLLEMAESEEGLRAGLQYNTDLFDRPTIERMLDHFETLLAGIVAAPDIPVSQLALLDATERQHVLEDFNDSSMETSDTLVHQFVEAQAERTPDAPAVCFGDDLLIYSELNARANRLARALTDAGAGPGSFVGICAERSIETVVGVLAVLKAGAAYVPIDPAYPAERIATMLEDSQACVLLTQSGLVGSLPAHGAGLIELDTFDWASGDDSNPGVQGDSVYAIYTSGSTGKPKGVELTQAGLSNLIQWQAAQPGLDSPARTLQFASLSFDVSFQELFTTWAQGGALVLVTEDERRDLAGLAKFIATDAIERVYLPFAALQPLADAVVNEPALNFAVRDVIVAGEQLQITPNVKAMFDTLGHARLHNQYGPSETHVVTAYTLQGAPETWPTLPPIGVPVANTKVYVLDTNLEPVPVGVPGELYLGGVQVARGYVGRPGLTAETFVANPFDGGRMYRTGDRVHFLADGNLAYLGRTDDQVKWRGFRLEPGEIETTLSLHASVKQAAVLLREDTPGDKRLVAYVVGDEPDPEALRLHLKERLPDYMVPQAFVILDSLPLTPSGKLARRSLPVPDYADAAEQYVAPRTPIEDALTEIWADVLNVERVGIHDDFFALGGHSLLATQLISRVRDTLNIELALKYVFRNTTPETLAAAIESLQIAGSMTEATPSDDTDDMEEFQI